MFFSNQLKILNGKCNYRGEKDKTLTDHFETGLKKIMQEPDLAAHETQFKEIYEKTHKRVFKSFNNAKFSDKENKSQLSNEEKETMHVFIKKSIDPEAFGDLDIILKFFILTSGAIAASSYQIDSIAHQVCYQALHQSLLDLDKRVLFLHALRCLKKLNIRIPQIAATFVWFGDLHALKLFQSVFGKEILDSKETSSGLPMVHFTFLDGFLHFGLEKLKWMIDEQHVDPTKRQVTFFGLGSIDALERFKMSVERTENNKRIYDEVTGYLCNEIKAAESKKSLKRKIKDCVVNRSFFNCEPLLRKIFKH